MVYYTNIMLSFQRYVIRKFNIDLWKCDMFKIGIDKYYKNLIYRKIEKIPVLGIVLDLIILI